jgi:DNA repair exonuclease SbcCD nuclease subunit
MKVAITADIHLRTKQKTPHRWQALENILSQLSDQGIDTLIIAGDLFDAESHNYAQFDELSKKGKFKKIDIHIIPGNHDAGIKQANFTAPNIKVYDQPKMVGLNKLSFLFIPYLADQTMANVLADCHHQLEQPWVLIGHGNWSETIRTINPVEPGVYMPLSKKVVQQYQPSLTVLGHIHKKMNDTNYQVYYPGSPCGLDITETGRRSYIVLDTTNLNVSRKQVNTDILYFDEKLVVYPMEKEKKYWQQLADEIKAKWDLSSKEKKNTVIRINISGFASNKRKLKEFFEQKFNQFQAWKDNKIDVSQVGSSTENYELLNISQQVNKRIKQLDLKADDQQPSKEEIIAQAVKTIYSQ